MERVRRSGWRGCAIATPYAAALWLTLLVVAACGSVTSSSSHAAEAPLARYGAATPVPASPSPALQSPSPMPPMTAAPMATPPAASPPAAMTFAITPLVSGGPRGTVTVMVAGGVAHYHVMITGLSPGTVHAIHDHAGTCGSANRSVHLSVLDIGRASTAGVISFDSSVAGSQAGRGRIVIVYAGASPALVIGCASL